MSTSRIINLAVFSFLLGAVLTGIYHAWTVVDCRPGSVLAGFIFHTAFLGGFWLVFDLKLKNKEK